MSLTKIEPIDDVALKNKSLIKELDISESDKYALRKYLQWKNYETKWKIITDSILDPNEFFNEIDNFSEEKKARLLKSLDEYFSNYERIENDKKNLKKIWEEIITDKLKKKNQISELKKQLNEISEPKKQLNEINWETSIWIQIYKLSTEEKKTLLSQLERENKNDSVIFIWMKNIAKELNKLPSEKLKQFKDDIRREMNDDYVELYLWKFDLDGYEMRLLSTALKSGIAWEYSREKIGLNFNENRMTNLKKALEYIIDSFRLIPNAKQQMEFFAKKVWDAANRIDLRKKWQANNQEEQKWGLPDRIGNLDGIWYLSKEDKKKIISEEEQKNGIVNTFDESTGTGTLYKLEQN